MQYITHAIPTTQREPSITPVVHRLFQRVVPAIIRQQETAELFMHGMRRVDVFGKAHKTELLCHQPDDFVLGLELVPITEGSVDVARRKRYDYNELQRGSYPETRDLQSQ